MPYLSHNYRYVPRSRHKQLVEMTFFIISSIIAIFTTLFLVGWLSAGPVTISPVVTHDSSLDTKTASR